MHQNFPRHSRVAFQRNSPLHQHGTIACLAIERENEAALTIFLDKRSLQVSRYTSAKCRRTASFRTKSRNSAPGIPAWGAAVEGPSKPQQQLVAALAIIASLIAHQKQHSMTEAF